MNVEFDTGNYSQNRMPDLRKPFMAKKLVHWGFARSIVEANISLVLVSVLLLGASAAILFFAKVITPSNSVSALSAQSIEINVSEFGQ